MGLPLPTEVPDVIVDDPQCVNRGFVTATTNEADQRYGSSEGYAAKGDGSATATCTPSVVTGGFFNVYGWRTRNENRATNAQCPVNCSGGSAFISDASAGALARE